MSSFSADPLGYYAILGLSLTAGDEEIKRSYREQAKRWHPDHNTDPAAVETFQKISVAYDVISDSKQRLIYDLLARIYPAAKFPDMKALKVYTNRKGQQEVNLRTVTLRQVIGKLTAFTDTSPAEICNFNEAKSLVLRNSLINWTLGWWNIPGLAYNLHAIAANYKNIGTNRQENLTLLVHNMLAYAQENKLQQAYLSGQLALDYAQAEEAGLINRFLSTLPPVQSPKPAAWNFRQLKNLQLLIPGILLFVLLMGVSTRVMNWREFNKYFARNNDVTYYQEVHFNSGRGVDDVVVSKVVDIPVDTEDQRRLYHVIEPVAVMYGPDDNFDKLVEIRGQTTVRLTGYTPNKVWARIMVDNGETGFVRLSKLKRALAAQFLMIVKSIPELGRRIFINFGTVFSSHCLD